MIQTSKPRQAASPCINVCALDAQNHLCQGCFRTIDEISRWSRVSNDERLSILDAAAQRRYQALGQ
ncbi:DUF1289 domain-containing protein [Propionivibrio sp.]|uniref:DUF1289 domain-containing protein n=1 Tax=Propionivibrio sp. TaxID=2212460 RepID=UPI0026205070|nr:DUF1289 domain-containing protein [Propionivibrio sp.]